MKLTDKPVPIVRVDERDSTLFTKYKINEYPTPLLFDHGIPIPYKGARFENEMFEWIQRVQYPLTNMVSTHEELTIIKELKFVSVLCLPDPDEDEKASILL